MSRRSKFFAVMNVHVLPVREQYMIAEKVLLKNIVIEDRITPGRND